MEKKITYLQNEEDVEKKLNNIMDGLDTDETDTLLDSYDFENIRLNQDVLKSIKDRTMEKAGIGELPEVIAGQEGQSRNKPAGSRHFKWKLYAAAAILFLLAVFTWKNSDNIVLAFNKMFGLIPGVGIVEDNKEILYRLKTPETAENSQGILSILSVVATKDAMTVGFSFERKDVTEEQLKKETKEEWERLKKEDRMDKPGIYLITGDDKYQTMSWGSSGGSLTKNFSFTFELEEGLINAGETYTIFYEEYGISAEFSLMTLEQYDSLEEIGATNIHNNISLTATSSLENGKLKVNVYPVNYSQYNLISFEQDYNLEYFGKKIALETENGSKTYTLPGSYGSGMNAAYGFDVSDGSKEFLLAVPFVAVESKEEEKVTLPIPKLGEVMELNKEIAFDKGSVIIKSVEKVMQDGGNEYGDLKMKLEYLSSSENQRLVDIEFQRYGRGGWGWSGEYDSDGRLVTIYYMLEKSDRSRLKLKAVGPRYVFMDEYRLTLDAN